MKRRTAINPLPWILGDSGYRLDRAVLKDAMTTLSAVGFTHLAIELPPEMTSQEYGALLAEHSFTPAPGYFSAPDYADRVLNVHLKDVDTPEESSAASLAFLRQHTYFGGDA
jgi:hypothetical protein